MEPIPVSQHALTAFEESATSQQIDSTTLMTVDREIANPYSINVPRELLQRTFEVLSFTWTNVTATQTIKFPGAFAGFSTITNALDKFPWFRSNIHVEIKMQSTPYHQGSLLVGWLPCPGAAPPLTTQMISGYDSTVLSASTQDSCSYDIPYLNPADWITTAIAAGQQDIAAMYITPLNVLLSSSSSIAANVPVIVYASFKDIEVSGYVSQMKSGSKFQTNNESSIKQDNGIDAKTAVSTVSQIVRRIPVIGDVYSPIANAINAFAGNLSKPTTTAPLTLVSQPYFNDVNQAAGITNAAQFSLYPNPYIKQAPTMFGMETSHMAVADIARRPLLHDQFSFTTVTQSWQEVVRPSTVGAVITTPDYLAGMMKIHRFWRGSIKYLFHFCMPAFYSVRVRISVDYGVGSPVNTADLQSRIIDIKGETWESVTVPFLARTTWADTNITNYEPLIIVQRITTIVGSSAPASPIIYVNIFRSAGEDFQLAGLRKVEAASITDSALVKFQNQMHIGKRFKESFPTLNKGTFQSMEKGLVMPEITGSVADVTKKQQSISTFHTYPCQSNQTAPPFYLCNYFMFWRGGRIMRRIHREAVSGDTGSGFYAVYNTDKDIDNGWTQCTSLAQQALVPQACHIHYMSAQPYYPMQDDDYSDVMTFISSPITASPSVTTHATATYTWAGADDFVCLFLVPWGLANAAMTKETKVKKKKVSPSQT